MTAQAQTPNVAVIYPDVREPYLEVFLDIIRGIEADLAQPVKQYLVKGNEEAPAAMVERLKSEQIDVVIGLGRAGLAVAKQLASAFPVVIGAAVIMPDQATRGLTGISLIPDPEVLFERLRELVPGAKEVTVIYDPRQKAWEIARASKAAKTHGLTLNALPSDDLRLSAELYRKALLEIKDGSIAVWLPQDNAAMDEQALLPFLLQEAWNKNFVVFSSNPDHVRKGALFSLYPDNFGLGRSLALMARSRTQDASSSAANIELLRDLLIAVNIRTAEHLGLNFSSKLSRKFDLTFPPQ